MNSSDSFFDIKAPLFREAFSQAEPYARYVAKGTPLEQSRWSASSTSLTLSLDQRETIRGFRRRMNVLVLSGLWCGDCARQGPMLDAIARETELIDLRFIDHQALPALRDELRIIGGARVPVAAFLSEDYFEVVRYGDRTLAAYRRKFREQQGPSCELGGAADEQTWRTELSEWLDVFERAQLILRSSSMLRKRYTD